MKNPLWTHPETWRIYGNPKPPAARPRDIDDKIVRLLVRAQLKALLGA